MAEASIDFLRTVPVFSEVSDRGLREIADQLKERKYSTGDVLLGEGEGGVGFFIIESGSASISKGGETLATLSAGDHFGEVALLAGSNRTATITATEDLVCWGMSAWSFRPLLKTQPSVALKLLEGLAQLASR